MVASPPSKAATPAPMATPPITTPPAATPPKGHGVPPPQFCPRFCHQENPNRPPSLPRRTPPQENHPPPPHPSNPHPYNHSIGKKRGISGF
ncbi:hypothetical protein GYH30_024685 [Glycine max]|nr:hypothetical protein GYH30_024685 [Glycine max]